jgi:hypothetical protein
MRILLGATLICLFASALPAAADTAVLSADGGNTLYETLDGPLSNGAGERTFAGVTTRGSKRRALLRFDISASLPAGAVITKEDTSGPQPALYFGGSKVPGGISVKISMFTNWTEA